MSSSYEAPAIDETKNISFDDIFDTSGEDILASIDMDSVMVGETRFNDIFDSSGDDILASIAEDSVMVGQTRFGDDVATVETVGDEGITDTDGVEDTGLVDNFVEEGLEESSADRENVSGQENNVEQGELKVEPEIDG